jgi:hypothetical protein
VTFPFILDLNRFVSCDGARSNDGGGNASSSDEGFVTPRAVAAQDEGAAGAAPSTDLKARALELIAANGPHVYELYSVLIHSGSLTGGHYYAYIKDVDSGVWCNFNDSSVTRIDEVDVLSAAGSDAGSRWSSANAYMLMYRRVVAGDSVNIASTASPGGFVSVPRRLPGVEAIPPYAAESVRAALAAAAAEEEAEAKRLAEIREKVTIRVHYRGDECAIDTRTSEPLDSLLSKVVKTFSLDEKWDGSTGIQDKLAAARASAAGGTELGPKPLPQDCIRLRNFDSQTLGVGLPWVRAAEEDFYGSGSSSSVEASPNVGEFSSRRGYLDVIVETRSSPLIPWPSWATGYLTVLVYRHDSVNDSLAPFERAWVPRNATLGDLTSAVQSAVGVPRAQQRLYKIDRTSYGTVTVTELMTNAAIGFEPAPLDGTARFNLSPSGSLQGDGLRIHGDLDLVTQWSDVFSVYVEQVPESERGDLAAPPSTETMPELMVLTPTAEAASSADRALSSSSASVSSNSYDLAPMWTNHTTVVSGSLQRAGLRICEANDVAVARAFQRAANAINLRIIDRTDAHSARGAAKDVTVTVDARASGRQVYAAMSSATGLSSGTFYAMREQTVVKVGDRASALGVSAAREKDVSVVIRRGAPPLENEFFVQLFVAAPSGNSRPGLSWLRGGAAALSGASEWFGPPLTAAEAAAHAAAREDEISALAAARLSLQAAPPASPSAIASSSDCLVMVPFGDKLGEAAPLTDNKINAGVLFDDGDGDVKAVSTSLFSNDADPISSSVAASAESGPAEFGESDAPAMPPEAGSVKALARVIVSQGSTVEELIAAALPALVRMGLLPSLEITVADGGDAAVAELKSRVRVREYSKSSGPGALLFAASAISDTVSGLFSEASDFVLEVLPDAEVSKPLPPPPAPAPTPETGAAASSLLVAAGPDSGGALQPQPQPPPPAPAVANKRRAPFVFFTVQWFDRSRWSLGPVRDALAPSTESTAAFARRIMSLPGAASRRAETLAAAGVADAEGDALSTLRFTIIPRQKANSGEGVSLSDLGDDTALSWFSTSVRQYNINHGEHATTPPAISDFWMWKDGASVIFCDVAEPLRALTMAEAKARGLKQDVIVHEAAATHNSAPLQTSTGATFSGQSNYSAAPQPAYRRREQGVKIVKASERANRDGIAAAAAAAAAARTGQK